MTCTVVIGIQWGDEGKGKITDLLAEKADYIVRYQGGNNAGHTIVIGEQVYKLHIIPSGILRPGKMVVIGDGCAVDPWVLETELDYLVERGIPTENLFISDRAHLIMPYHRALDGIQERGRAEGGKVGTTGRGIGPCYQDKAGRFGIRAGDLRYPNLVDERINYGVESARVQGDRFSVNVDLDPGEIVHDLYRIYKKLKPYIRDTPYMLNRVIDEGAEILLEGAQGAFLDIDRGTYPFVTSSSCTVGYASGGSGIGPLSIDRVVGVVKAYTTRVGGGPFPVELVDPIGEHLRERGHEYGTTTSRPRRCGWLDLVMVRSSTKWNSVTTLALTKIDVLSGLEWIKVCTEYRIPEELAQELSLPAIFRHFPSHIEILKDVEPVYLEVEGFGDIVESEWDSMRDTRDLPRSIRGYLSLIEEETGVPIGILSYGPRRSQTIVLDSDLI